MLPRGEERAKGVSHFQNSPPRPRKMGPKAASLPLSRLGERSGGRRVFFQGGEEEKLQKWEVDTGSQMENQGEAGPTSPKVGRRKVADQVIPGDGRVFPLSCPGFFQGWESESTRPLCRVDGRTEGQMG